MILSFCGFFRNKEVQSGSDGGMIMSKIRCKCGNMLPDNTDKIRYKGYIISDQELFNMFDLADEMIVLRFSAGGGK